MLGVLGQNYGHLADTEGWEDAHVAVQRPKQDRLQPSRCLKLSTPGMMACCCPGLCNCTEWLQYAWATKDLCTMRL